MRAPTNVRPIVAGDRVSIRRHSGVSIRGTVTAVGEWQPSCAGSPMRWVHYTDARTGAACTVADTPHRDNDVMVVTS
jgi:hypothetical protein